MKNGVCSGLVAVVTGGGRGIGRSEAIELARQGASIVVNDLGAAANGEGASAAPAEQVAEEIREMGGKAVANNEDVSNFEAAGRLIQLAINTFGDLHILVNNAGIIRDRLLISMMPEEWDDVIRVHLRGTYAPTHHAANYWRRRRMKALDSAAVINTTSASGLYGNSGQSNYGAAKAGVAAFTIIAAQELASYGVTVNAVAPAAATRLTEKFIPASMRAPKGSFDPLAADNIAPLVAWLASPGAREVTGRVFNVMGGRISIANGWVAGPEISADGPWNVHGLGERMHSLLSEARAPADSAGRVRDAAGD